MSTLTPNPIIAQPPSPHLHPHSHNLNLNDHRDLQSKSTRRTSLNKISYNTNIYEALLSTNQSFDSEKIIYSTKFLLKLKKSPLLTHPTNLPNNDFWRLQLNTKSSYFDHFNDRNPKFETNNRRRRHSNTGQFGRFSFSSVKQRDLDESRFNENVNDNKISIGGLSKFNNDNKSKKGVASTISSSITSKSSKLKSNIDSNIDFNINTSTNFINDINTNDDIPEWYNDEITPDKQHLNFDNFTIYRGHSVKDLEDWKLKKRQEDGCLDSFQNRKVSSMSIESNESINSNNSSYNTAITTQSLNSNINSNDNNNNNNNLNLNGLNGLWYDNSSASNSLTTISTDSPQSSKFKTLFRIDENSTFDDNTINQFQDTQNIHNKIINSDPTSYGQLNKSQSKPQISIDDHDNNQFNHSTPILNNRPMSFPITSYNFNNVPPPPEYQIDYMNMMPPPPMYNDIPRIGSEIPIEFSNIQKFNESNSRLQYHDQSDLKELQQQFPMNNNINMNMNMDPNFINMMHEQQRFEMHQMEEQGILPPPLPFYPPHPHPPPHDMMFPPPSGFHPNFDPRIDGHMSLPPFLPPPPRPDMQYDSQNDQNNFQNIHHQSRHYSVGMIPPNFDYDHNNMQSINFPTFSNGMRINNQQQQQQQQQQQSRFQQSYNDYDYYNRN